MAGNDNGVPAWVPAWLSAILRRVGLGRLIGFAVMLFVFITPGLSIINGAFQRPLIPTQKQNRSKDGKGHFLASSFDISDPFWLAYGIFDFVILDFVVLIILPEDAVFNQSLIFTSQTFTAGLVLAFAAFSIPTLADVLSAYLAGLCCLHVLFDTIQLLGLNGDTALTVVAIFGIICSNTVSIGFQDSFQRLGNLNTAYLFFVLGCCVVVLVGAVVCFCSARVARFFTDYPRVLPFMGILTSVVHMGFCAVAFFFSHSCSWSSFSHSSSIFLDYCNHVFDCQCDQICPTLSPSRVAVWLWPSIV